MAIKTEILKKRFTQLNTWIIIVLLGILLLVGIFDQKILDSNYLAQLIEPSIEFLGMVTVFCLFACMIVILVNYFYSSLLKVSRSAFYNEVQKAELIKILKDPAVRTDYQFFKMKANENVTKYPNYLSEIVASILPTALAQPFVLEQYFNAKIDNISKRYADPINTIILMSNVAPILGFAGTLLGLIKAFAESAAVFAREQAMTVEAFQELQVSIVIAIITSLIGVAIKIIGSILKHSLMVKSARYSEEVAEIPREVMYERRVVSVEK